MAASGAGGGKAAAAGAPKVTRDEAQLVFDQYDADGNGTIDRSELQQLAFHLGRLLTDEDLEVAFAKLDADGSGSVDFEELYEWLNAEEAEGSAGSKSTQAALRASLTRRVLMKRAARLKRQFDHARTQSGGALPGTAKVDVSLSWGAGVEKQEPENLGVDLVIGGPGTTAMLSDTSAEADERATVQLFMALNEGVSDEAVKAFLDPLNDLLTTEEYREMAEEGGEDVGLSRVQLMGPLPLPDGSGRAVVLQVFLKKDPTKPLLKAFEKFSAMDAEAQAAAEGKGEGKEDPQAELGSLALRLLEKFHVSLRSDSSLAELLGRAPFTGGTSNATLSLDLAVATGVMTFVSTFLKGKVAEDTYGSLDDDAAKALGKLQAVLAARSVTLDSTISQPARVANAAAAALALCHDTDEWGGTMTRRASSVAAAHPLAILGFQWQHIVSATFLRSVFEDYEEDSERLPLLRYMATGQPDGQYSAAAFAEGAVDEEGDPLDFMDRVQKAAYWGIRWLLANLASLHTFRVAGRGLGVTLALSGFSIPALAQLLEEQFQVGLPVAVAAAEDRREAKAKCTNFLLFGTDPQLVDAARLWPALFGLKDNRSTFGLYGYDRKITLPNGLPARLEPVKDDDVPWRLAAVDSRWGVWEKAHLECDLLDNSEWVQEYDEDKEKPRLVFTAVLPARSVPGVLGGAAAAPELNHVATTLGKMLAKAEEEAGDASGASAAQKAWVSPWVTAIIDTAAAKVPAGAEDAAVAPVREALQVPAGIPVHVIFADLASGGGVRQGLGRVAAAVRESRPLYTTL